MEQLHSSRTMSFAAALTVGISLVFFFLSWLTLSFWFAFFLTPFIAAFTFFAAKYEQKAAIDAPLISNERLEKAEMAYVSAQKDWNFSLRTSLAVGFVAWVFASLTLGFSWGLGVGCIVIVANIVLALPRVRKERVLAFEEKIDEGLALSMERRNAKYRSSRDFHPGNGFYGAFDPKR